MNAASRKALSTNGRSANSYSSYRGGIGILARTVESHFEPRSYAAALELGTYYQHGCRSGPLEIISVGTRHGVFARVLCLC